MSPSSSIDRAAALLREARQSRSPIPQVSASCGISTLDAAYAVSEALHRERLAAGGRVAGKKIGLTSKAVQLQLGVDQPDFGFLYTDMEFQNGAVLPANRLIQPKVEAEVAFVVGRDMASESPTYGEFLRCLDHALPALEIVDSAIQDWKITLVDTVADNASSGLYVLGDQPVAISSQDLGDIGMSLHCDGETVSVGSGAACLGHPLRAAYWLARTMAARGQALRAGEVILSGALGPMVPLVAGRHYTAAIGGVGSVRCSLA